MGGATGSDGSDVAFPLSLVRRFRERLLAARGCTPNTAEWQRAARSTITVPSVEEDTSACVGADACTRS